MENKKNVIIILTIINSFLFVLGLFFGLGFLAISRCGHTGVLGALFAADRFESLITLIIVSIIALWILITTKKRKENFKFIRLVATVYLIISLIVIVWGIFFVFSYAGSTCSAIEVAIKANVSHLRVIGEGYIQENGSYEGFCQDDDMEKVYKAIKDIKSVLICNNTSEEWAACAQLIRKEEYYVCLDSSGDFSDGLQQTKQIKGKCDENWEYTQCPE